MRTHVNFKSAGARVVLPTAFEGTDEGPVSCMSEHMRGEVTLSDELFITVVTPKGTRVSVSA